MRYEQEKFSRVGWRVCLRMAGTTFTRYIPDNQFEGSARKSLAAAEKILRELKVLLAGAKLVDGKLSASTIRKAQKVLADAV